MSYTSKYAQDAMEKSVKPTGDPKKKRTVKKGTVGENSGSFKNVTRRSGTKVSTFRGESGTAKKITKPSGKTKEIEKPSGGKRTVTRSKK